MIHFVVNVILPLLMAIFYLCRSITNPLTF
jgi:hypothetical protein